MGTASHEGQCAICKSEKRKEFDDAYIAGEPVSVLAKRMQFEKWCADRHVSYFDLLTRRCGNTLRNTLQLVAACQDARELNKVAMNSGTEVQALRLQGELQKELINRHPLIIKLLGESPEAQAAIDRALYGPPEAPPESGQGEDE